MSQEKGMVYTFHVPAPCKDEVTVVYADDEIVLVDKPAGLLSVPGRILKDSVFQRLLYSTPICLSFTDWASILRVNDIR